jgi:endonuclease/exonuclease/phosphatase family metal-dependent hydrolase
VRLATFNILSGRSPSEQSVDEGRFADAISRLDVDVLALQEVDRDQPRSGHVDLTALAAEAMGAVAHRFVPALFGTPGSPWSAAADDERVDGPAYGIALVSRLPVRAWRVVHLPAAPVKVLYRFPGRALPEWVRDEPRVCVVADIESPDGPVQVACTHLSFLPGWNRHQLRRLVSALSGEPEPLVLAGDLNMSRTPAERLTGMRPLAIGRTFPADQPTRQIDHLLVRGALEATIGGPVQLPVSDHRALVSDVGRSRAR